MGKDWIPGGISAAAPGALGTTMYGKRPATGGSMGGGLTAAPRFDPMTPEGGAILDPNRPRGGGFDGEAPVRPTPRPMGPSIGRDPSYGGGEIWTGVRPDGSVGGIANPMDPGRRGQHAGYDGSGINPNGQFGPRPRRPGGPGYRRGPRSNQPGHGDGNGGQMDRMVREQLSYPRENYQMPARLPLLNKGGQMGVPTPEGGPVYTPGGANEEFLRGGGGGWA